MSCFSFFYIGPDALPHLPMPPGYHFSRKNTAAEVYCIHCQNAASLHTTLLHPNKRKTSELCQNSTKTTQTLFSLFSFIFLIFILYLSIFISFFAFFFFYTSSVASIFAFFFGFCERGSGRVWPAGGAWARQRGVWSANCVHGVCSGRAEALHLAMWFLPLACLQTTQWLCRP